MGDSKEKKLYTLKEVSEHSSAASCWIVIWNRVYDVTKFLAGHPGGEDVIMEVGGKDATVEFDGKGHSQIANELMEEYLIGELVEEERRKKTQ